MRSALPCILIVAGAVLVGAPTLAQKNEATALLSKEARKAIDDVFKDWEIAPMPAASGACEPDGGPPAAVARGDFNSDGQPDVATQIKTADGVIHLVMVFARMTDSVVSEVDRVGQGTAGGFLVVEPRGRSFVNPAGGLQDYFVADTVALYRCNHSRTAYLWTGLGFRKVELPEEINQN
jgi:hypothetical protein